MAFIINIGYIREKIMAEIFDTEKKYTNGNIFWDRNFDKYWEFFFLEIFQKKLIIKKMPSEIKN